MKQRAVEVDTGEEIPFTPKHIIGLILFALTIVFIAFGSLKFGWSYAQICGLYVLLAIILAILFRMPIDKACAEFTKGVAAVVLPCLVIGLARSVSVLLESGRILDTFVNFLGNALGSQSPVVTLLIIYLFITLFNFLVMSGSGKAVMLMPILSPLGRILNINQQVMVLAYSYGDGFTNTFWPAGAIVMSAMFGVTYGQWMKFCWKAFACLIVSGYVLIVIADKIKLGPG
jgi:uncharacterized ion transporter superfamily protein YfcC